MPHRSYVILQGLSGSAAGFLQAVPLVIYYAKLYILGSTPRAVYNIKYQLRSVSWGTLYPAMTLITCISECPRAERSVVSSNNSNSNHLFNHLPDHQWSLVFHVLFVLPVVQIPLPVPVRPTCVRRHWRLVLPEGNPACLRWVIHPTNLSGCVVLPSP